MTDNEDFEDLFDGGDMLEDSSQESLTNAAANLAFCESDEEGEQYDRETSPVTSRGSNDDTSSTKKPAVVARTRVSFGEWPQHEHLPLMTALSPPTSPSVEPKSAAPSRLVLMSSAAESRSGVIDKIEDVFEQIADAMLNEQDEIGLTLKARTKATTGALQHPHEVPVHRRDTKIRRVCFPGKSAKEAWRFTVVIRILELMHEALRNGVTISKRDMYYRDPALFNSQTTVDRYVDDIAFTFGVPRSALNITAVVKGLVVGPITFCRRDGSIVNAAADRDGMLVPSLKEVLSVDMIAVRWILVIEKEASFRSIAASAFWATHSTQGVLITGKGYPDIATRALLRYLSTPSPQNGFTAPPVYGLVDYDPDGLAILSTYKYGSIALAHENAELRVPQLQWLGLRSEHMLLGGESTHGTQGLLALTARDRNRARKMLERDVLDNEGQEEADFRRELQVMLLLNMKAELQLLDATPNGISDLLEGQLGGL